MNSDLTLISGITSTVDNEGETITVSCEEFSRTYTFLDVMGAAQYNKRHKDYTAVVGAATEAAFMFRDSFLEVAEAMKKRC